MSTECWALIVSVIALLASIGIPIWQWSSSNAQSIASKRTLLLQRILSTKSVTFVSMHELNWLLQRHGEKMNNEQRTNLIAMLPRMRQHHDDLETLHSEWSDYRDKKTLIKIEQALSDVDVASSEADDTARLIENGRRTYEDT